MTNRGGHLSDAELLLELIRQSEEDLRRGHWVSHDSGLSPKARIAGRNKSSGLQSKHFLNQLAL
jgi:hypothetical protein